MASSLSLIVPVAVAVRVLRFGLELVTVTENLSVLSTRSSSTVGIVSVRFSFASPANLIGTTVTVPFEQFVKSSHSAVVRVMTAVTVWPPGTIELSILMSNFRSLPSVTTLSLFWFASSAA